MTSIKEYLEEAKKQQRRLRIQETAHKMYMSCMLDTVVSYLTRSDVAKVMDILVVVQDRYLKDLGAPDLRVNAELQAVRDEFTELVDQQLKKFEEVRKYLAKENDV